ncbi:MAG: AAA family ATPase [Sedimentisphaerales bacterium]|nr:AAA family ATPase [Sedimentisphaerales bacterium]
MPTYTVSKHFPWQGPVSKRTVQVCRMFGLALDRLSDHAPTHSCCIEVSPGDIVYITGPSGSGKSVLLHELERQVPAGDAVRLTQMPLPDDRTVIDCFESDVVATLRTLSTVGLGDAFSVVNRPCNLSEGQRYRFRLAQALATGKRFIFADEFGSELDRITAATLAFNIHRFAKRTDTTFVLASSHRDFLLDLAPDVVVTKDFGGAAQVVYRTAR